MIDSNGFVYSALVDQNTRADNPSILSVLSQTKSNADGRKMRLYVFEWSIVLIYRLQ